ncbi:MAG: tetratricopeptide repeat protein [Planctomycetia bacterium]|nr:tetratricopeptide repeat protein [Planctomycetia bacterium]
MSWAGCISLSLLTVVAVLSAVVAVLSSAAVSLAAGPQATGSDPAALALLGADVSGASLSPGQGASANVAAETALSVGQTFDVLGMMSRSEFEALAPRDHSWFVFVPVADAQSGRGLAFQLHHLNEADIELLADAADGSWDTLTPIEAMLVAEGKSASEERRYYQQLFDQYALELEKQTTGVTSDLMKTRLVFDFLHQRVLRSRYDLNRSSLAASLDQGVFNCVSATVLFNCFAERVGLRTAGLETTGHAKSRVLYDNGFLDIETTCTRWSLLPDRFQMLETHTVARPVSADGSGVTLATGSLSETFVPASGNAEDDLTPSAAANSVALPKTGELTQPELPQGVAHGMKKKVMRQINAVGLTATIYYNRGVDFSQAGRFEEALDSYIKAIQLDPHNKTILGNLKATLNNWAINLAAKSKNFPVSIRLAECGLELDPEFEQFKTNLPIFYQHWISELEKEKRFEEADYLTEIFRSRFGK